MRRDITAGVSGVVLTVLLLIVLLLGWEGYIRWARVPSYLFPAPSGIASSLWRGLQSGVYLGHARVTLAEVLGGFLIGASIGFVLGALIALNKTVAFFLRPYVLAFQTIPKVALVPIIVLWFGLGMSSKIVAAAIICFFPVMINTIAGLNAADPDRVALLRAMGATKFQVFRMLRLPTAGPFVFAGLEIAITFALIGAIVAEFLGAERGLGMLMQSMNFSMDTAGSFSVIVLLSVIGMSLTWAIIWLRRRVLYWEREDNDRKP